MIDAVLPFPPSVNGLFFNRKGGRTKTVQYALWQRQAGWELKLQKQKPIKGPVGLMYTYQDNRKADLGNLEKPVSDLLVKHGLIEDDGPKVVRWISLSFSDKVEGVRVKVFKVEGDK